MLLERFFAADDQQHFLRAFGENIAAWPAELPPPATITVEPRQSWPSRAVAA
jgi:hypothetical protein